MPVELLDTPAADSRPVRLVSKGDIENLVLPDGHRAWVAANGFAGEAGRLLLLPDHKGGVDGALLGLGDGEGGALAAGAIARALPAGDWHFEVAPAEPSLASLAAVLGGYVFTRYGRKASKPLRLAVPSGTDAAAIRRTAEGVFLARDLINAPANDMGPDDLEKAARALAAAHAASVSVVAGDELIEANFPMIHAVGRAAAQAPRLVDMVWGRPDARKVTLVGKGVCFDTGGLDIKTASGMLLMKKDMGGAANVLGLASMLMSAGADIRLRVLLPVVENAIAGNAFRPGDILPSRKGITVEIGNTDAEGRLILADALTLADEDQPDLLVDMATLTGAARIALGPDLPPFYTADDGFAAKLMAAAQRVEDPLWRMPLWKPYDARLASKVADVNNVTSDGFAGSIMAALFLQRFVEKARTWAHFDIFGWNPSDRPSGLAGGEAQAIRALEAMILAGE